MNPHTLAFHTMGTNRTLLVTGGCGFIGSNFIRFVLRGRPGWSVVNIDSLAYAGNPNNLADVQDDTRYRLIHADINDRDCVDTWVARCDAVIHFAAQSHVDRSIQDPHPFVTTNTLGTQTLLESVRCHAPQARFVYISTDEVYGSLPLDQPGQRFTEDTPLAPNSPYAASKAAGDLMARAYHHTFGLDTVITRCPNNFGPYQFPEKIIPLFVTNLLQGKPVPLYGDGKNVRDWIHVDDHCQALLVVLEKAPPGQTYNIGANNERSNLELTHTLLEIMGHPHDMIQPVPDRPGHDRRYAIDAAKIQRELGWRPTRSAWPQALQDTVRWYTDHPAWWGPLTQRPASQPTNP